MGKDWDAPAFEDDAIGLLHMSGMGMRRKERPSANEETTRWTRVQRAKAYTSVIADGRHPSAGKYRPQHWQVPAPTLAAVTGRVARSDNTKRRKRRNAMSDKTWAEVTASQPQHVFQPAAGTPFQPRRAHAEVPLLRIPNEPRASFRRWKWHAGNDGYEAWLLARMRNVSERPAAGAAAAAAMRALTPFLSPQQRHALHALLQGSPTECLRVVVNVADRLSAQQDARQDDALGWNMWDGARDA